MLALILAIAGTGLRAEGTRGSLPAFPGAEGWGATTPGGRGGRVIRVTNLNTSGPGSLQEACSAEGPRIVVFDTSGVIPGPVSIKYGQITIAGQTAPGAGITIKGMLSTPWDPEGLARYEDLVIRFLRIRPAPIPGVSWADGIQFTGVRRCVLDHVSCSWASDETVDFNAQDITIQWCAIEESDTEGHPKGRHNFGLLFTSPDSAKASIHHTLFAHHSRRCPAICNGPADIRNIVAYNFRDGLSHEGHQPYIQGFNIIGNYYKTGPSDPHIYPFNFIPGVSYYLRDNYIEDRTSGFSGLIQDPWAEADSLHGFSYYADKGTKALKEFEGPPVTTHTPLEAYGLVLERAGCFPRDTVSRRTISEVRSGTGTWGRRDPGDLMAGLSMRAAPADTDGDGMPDAWERAKKLDPEDGTDHSTVMESSYTAIEEYVNMLA
ncbi:MAG: pectate lyase precursor, partial [Gemmatimonadota bacterium]|nr:pectate lyase precursor [Gemmatimonadota bacterium]